MLMAGEKQTMRCYLDIPVDADSLDDDFKLLFFLPTSGNDLVNFTYEITAEGRLAAAQEEERLAQEEEARLAALKEEALEEIDPAIEAEIKKQITGGWEFKQSNISYKVEFKNDNCIVTSTISGAKLTNEGPYYIRKDAIEIAYVTGLSAYMVYTYENGKVTFSNFLGESEFIRWLDTR